MDRSATLPYYLSSKVTNTPAALNWVRNSVFEIDFYSIDDEMFSPIQVERLLYKVCSIILESLRELYLTFLQFSSVRLCFSMANLTLSLEYLRPTETLRHSAEKHFNNEECSSSVWCRAHDQRSEANKSHAGDSVVARVNVHSLYCTDLENQVLNNRPNILGLCR